jgi:hypothetical protein
MSNGLQSYKNSVESLADDWAKTVVPLFKDAVNVLKELTPLSKNKNPGPDEKKKINDLKKQCSDIKGKIEKATSSFNQRLQQMSPENLTAAEENDLKKLIQSKWFENYIKGKPIPASDRNWLLSWKVVARMNFDQRNKVLGTIAVMWEQ